jgi:hypothetical protein
MGNMFSFLLNFSYSFTPIKVCNCYIVAAFFLFIFCAKFLFLQGLTTKTHNVRGQLVKSSSDANMVIINFLRHL